MEKESADRSVSFFAYVHTDRAGAGGFSPIFITAALSVLVLAAVAGWEMNQSVRAHNALTEAVTYNASALPGEGAGTSQGASSPADSTSTDPISAIGPAIMGQLQGAYDQMQQGGVYSTTTAQAVAASLAPYVTANVPFPTVTARDIKTDADTSYTRMLKYRSDLRVSFAPLLKNTQPEYEIFAYYAATKDASYLTKLRAVAQNYRDAANLTAKVVAPADAVTYHVAILNAMEEFGATLDALADHASDPFASVALLRTYNQSEADMLTSFNALTVYYKSKQP